MEVRTAKASITYRLDRHKVFYEDMLITYHAEIRKTIFNGPWHG
jgi:hypothetical protein